MRRDLAARRTAVLESVPAGARKAAGLLWPNPGTREVRIVGVLMICAGLTLALASISRAVAGRTLLGRDLGGDFAAFYGAGKILNEYPKTALYDLGVQTRIYQELAPNMGRGKTLVFAYPPFVGVLFQPLARIPYI
jgi:hypothetical protein